MMENLLDRIEKLEQENVEMSNILYEILNRVELLENDHVLRSDRFRESNGNVCQ